LLGGAEGLRDLLMMPRHFCSLGLTGLLYRTWLRERAGEAEGLPEATLILVESEV